MKRQFLIVPLSLSLACQPEVRVSRAHLPVQTTFAALRALYGPETIVDCRLPEASPAANAVTLTTADQGLSMRLPASWQERAPVDAGSGDPEIVWAGPDSSRIRLARITNGGTGPQYMVTFPASDLVVIPPCETSAGDAGVIWRFYDPAANARRVRPLSFDGMGALITRAGWRYAVTVSAATPNERDRLARRVSDAVLEVP